MMTTFTKQRDIRATAPYQEALALYETLRRPGTGQICDASEIDVAPDGKYAAFAGTLTDALEGVPPTRICLTDLMTGDTRVLTFGPNADRSPKFSRDGTRLAFLSDRRSAGNFQLHILDLARGAVMTAPSVEGWVEYLHWSPDGLKILLGVAGHGADISGGQGAITSKTLAGDAPAWMPSVQTGQEESLWRSAWVYEPATDRMQKVSPAGANIWEAAWCGNDALAAVVSSGPSEGLWYGARLHIFKLSGGSSREIYAPAEGNQPGWPAASPSGKLLAIVEAVCSDRWVVAGDLRLITTATGDVQRIDTRGMDVTCTQWCSEKTLLLAGHRGLDSVVGIYDVASREFREVWTSREITTSGFHITVAGYGDAGNCVLVGEGFTRAAEIGVIHEGEYRAVRSFDLGRPDHFDALAAAEALSWPARDGLEIQGWLLRPKAQGPRPLVMFVHGGPVAHWRPFWLGRRGASVLMLLRRGYAVFFPNPRGSTGRGQDFVRHVVGDMGGADTYDYLAGLDYLVGRGIADPKRLGVTGASYGGFMSSWLITQDPRFAAAVVVAPTTNQVSQHLVSNIPHFVSLFLGDTYTNPQGKYFSRSPIMHAHKVKTPALNICGALDRCTPPEEAVQFHNALLENGVESVLVTYPQEGHGVRQFPAAMDYAARLVTWFDEHLQAHESK
jgi:dipeptidyl aminopeptidase/acylaminoacyl peptidase